MTNVQKQERVEIFRRYSTKVRLSAEQERDLIIQAQSGDTQARHDVGRIFLGYVLAVVAKQPYAALKLEDAIHEGTIGLMMALDKFNVDRGGRFSTYAIWWIRAYVNRFLQEDSSIVRPRGGNYAVADWSLDASVDDDEGSPTRLDQVVDETQGEERCVSHALSAAVREAMGQFDHAVDREIIEYRLGCGPLEGDSLQDIGDRHGVSRERVRQRELRVREKLEKRLASFKEVA